MSGRILNLLLKALKWFWSYKKTDNEPERYSIIGDSFFAPFVPEILFRNNLGRLFRNTKSLLRYKCNYMKTNSFDCSKQFSYLLNFQNDEATVAKLLFRGCREYLRGVPNSYIEKAIKETTDDYDNYFLYCYIEECPITIQMAPYLGILSVNIFFNVWAKKHFVAYEKANEMVEFALSNAADGSFVLPKRAEPLIKIMKSFKLRYFGSNVKRGLVVLLHGEPGTGKTLLASLLSDYIIGYSKFYSSDIIGHALLQGLSPQRENNVTDNGSLTSVRAEEQRANGSHAHATMPIEILDEFDSFGSYMKENSLQKEMNNKLKTLLDSASGVVFLITNHIDEIDPIILRQGRVTCIYEVGCDFYSVEEKKMILSKYKQLYEINESLGEDTILGSPITDTTTLASIENSARLYSLDHYLDKDSEEEKHNEHKEIE